MNPARNLRGQIGCECLSIGPGTRGVARRAAGPGPGTGGRSRGWRSGRDGGPEATQEPSDETCRIISSSPSSGAKDGRPTGVGAVVVTGSKRAAVGRTLGMEVGNTDAGEVVGDGRMHEKSSLVVERRSGMTDAGG